MKKFLILTCAFFSLLYTQSKAQAGAALKFDGTNDYVQVGNVLGTSYTKEAWIKITNLTLSNNIISGSNTDGRHAFHAATTTGNRLSSGHNGNYTMVQDPTPLVVNTWYHVAVTYDAATTTMNLYKNGVLVSTNAAVPAYTNGNMVRLGSSGAAIAVLGGMMDEVRIWNYARAASDIATYRNCELTGTEVGLNQYYRFNQGIASGNNAGLTSLTDLAGTAQNGTLTNFALTGSASNWVTPGGVVTGNSCCATASGAITSQTNVSCNGGNNGSATITASGGTSFTYSWAPSGGTAATASGLTAGSYTCTIINQCTSSATVLVTITEPAVLTVSASSSPICIGSTGSINASSTGGSGIIVYTWTPGAFSGSSVPVSPLSTTTYSVTATDGNGCTATDNTTLTVNSLPTVTAVSNPVNGIICSGSQATLTASGAASYSWTGGVTNAVPFTPVTTATYTVTGTDGNGCQGTTTKTITVNTCGGPTLTAASCNATNMVLSQWLYNNAVAGATNYQYVLTNTVTGQTHSRIKGNSQPNMPLSWIAGLVYGQSYIVQVRAYVGSAWGTYGPASCTITLAANAPTTQLTSTYCNSTNLSNTSRIYCTQVTGGSSYRFTLTNGTYTQTRVRTVNNIQLYQFTGLLPNTTYTVTVTEYSGGMWSAPVSSPTCTITTGSVLRLGNPDAEEIPSEADAVTSFAMLLYPNPMGSGIAPTLTLSGANGQNAIVTVLDISGRVVTSNTIQVSADEFTTPLENFPVLASGIYVMQVTIGDKQENTKFIVE